MSYKPGLYSSAIAAKKYTEEQIKKASQKIEAITLKELGKYSAFKEVFENIPLEEQDFSYTNLQVDIITNPNFIEGRTFGFVLIKNGFNEENYKKYVNSTKHR